MKNLVALLKLKAQKQTFVIQTEQGLVPMSNNVKGVIKNVDESIAQELFGSENPMSEENQKLFVQLKRVRFDQGKAKKDKEKKV